MNNFNEYVNISILDWIGKVRGGVSVLLTFKIINDTYDIVYWFHPNGEYRIIMDKRFMIKFNIENIYEQPYFDELKDYIDHKVLPSKSEIWSEYDIEVKQED